MDVSVILERRESHMSKGKVFFIIVSLIGVGFLFMASPSPSEAAKAAEPIYIGTVQPVTGPYAAFGTKFYQCYNLAADEINAKGGIKGRPIKILFEDSQDKMDLGQTAAEKLIARKETVAIIGGRLSGVGYAIAQICERAKMPYLVDHPSADVVTKSGFQWTFRLNPASSFNSMPLQQFIKK